MLADVLGRSSVELHATAIRRRNLANADHFGVLHAAELAGLDPAEVIGTAIAARDLTGARDIAAVIDARIRRRVQPTPNYAAATRSRKSTRCVLPNQFPPAALKLSRQVQPRTAVSPSRRA